MHHLTRIFWGMISIVRMIKMSFANSVLHKDAPLKQCKLKTVEKNTVIEQSSIYTTYGIGNACIIYIMSSFDTVHEKYMAKNFASCCVTYHLH